MMQERAWGVETSTAQSEIIGRRHYGRKAVAAGGGGGRGATRELFDTLLVWKPNVVLDANGEATIEVPLNDSLTSFRLVAVADARRAEVRHRQHQHPRHPGPAGARRPAAAGARRRPLRGDADAAQHDRARDEGARHAAGHGQPAGRGAGEIARVPIALPAQDVVVAAGAAREVVWPVDVPADAFSITWEGAAEASRARRIA